LAAKGVGAAADLKTKTVARIEMLDIFVVFWTRIGKNPSPPLAEDLKLVFQHFTPGTILDFCRFCSANLMDIDVSSSETISVLDL